jgi:hypothetical protein
MILRRHGNIEILIGKSEKKPRLINDFLVHYSAKRILKKLVFVDYDNKRVITEVPATEVRQPNIWAEPVDFRLDGWVIGIIGILTSENRRGPSSASCLGLIREYDPFKNEPINPFDPPDPDIDVDCFEFPSKEDAQRARLLLSQLVGTVAVGFHIENDTYEILALEENSVNTIAQAAK